MSRIGKMPIELPEKVEFKQAGTRVTIKGQKGELTQSFNPSMKMSVEDRTLTVERKGNSKEARALHGLTRALLNNMVVGVTDGFEKKLVINGVGYRAAMQGDKLVLTVGHSHPVEFNPPKDLSFEVEDRGKTIFVRGIDKQVVGELSAQIRKVRPPEPYKGKGIAYEGEHIRRKAGKAGKV